VAKLGALAPPRVALPRLAALRRRAGLSQVKLAKRAGLTPSTVSKFELGLQQAEPRHVAKLAAALGVAPAELSAPAEQAP
jgi:transcriptional regulator with XRE-family HTH domain